MFNFNGHKKCILRIMNNLNGRGEYFLWKGGALGLLWGGYSIFKVTLKKILNIP